MEDVYIFDAIRTPRGKGRASKNGKPGGALSTTPPHKLVAQLVSAMGRRHSPELLVAVESLTLGCVGQVQAQGGHIALISRLASELSDDVPAKTLNNYCISGLTATIDGALRIKAGGETMALTGGVESLSYVPFLADKASFYTDPNMVRELRYAPPIMGAELVASLEGYAKEDLDALTLRSHMRAAKAWDAGCYEPSVVPVLSDAGVIILDRDELIRPDLTWDALQAMPPAFAAQGALGYDAMMLAEYPELSEISHIHSIANCPGMADGASLILLGNAEAEHHIGSSPKAKIVDFAETGGSPVLQLTAGFAAMETVLKRQNISLFDIDRIEFMEAFAAIPLKFLRDYDVDPDTVNVNGGHIRGGRDNGDSGGAIGSNVGDDVSGGAAGGDGSGGRRSDHGGGGHG